MRCVIGARRRWGKLLTSLGLGLLCWSGVAFAAEKVELRIEGVSDELLGNVTAALVLPPGLAGGDRVDAYWLERFVNRIPGLVGAALKPYGYYHSRTQAHLAPAENGLLPVLVRIQPGEPIRIEQARIEVTGAGSQEPSLRELADTFPLAPGEVLRQDYYEGGKGALKAKALDLGYLDADFSQHALRIDRSRNLAALELVLDTGPLYRFGPLLLHGAPEFPQTFLRRYVVFKEGNPFSYPLLGQTQLNFLDSDRFREVIVNPRKDLASDLAVPVAIQLTPAARRRLRPGVGYGTDTGPRFSLRYQDLNMLRQGHEFKTDLDLAQWKQSLSSSYLVPSPTDLEGHNALKVAMEREDAGTYETRTISAEVERLEGFGHGRLGSVYVRLLQEDYIVGNEDARSRMILPGVRFVERHYLDPVRPRSGRQYSIEVRGGHQLLGSDTGLLQTLASANTLLSLPGPFSLFLRAEGGMTWQNEPLREIPASLRFFAGGDKSLRGYAYQSLGPTDSSGLVVGGRHLAVGGGEIEWTVGQNWGLALFYDVGNAFNDWRNIDWRQGAGVGVRRYTAVGPVKFDLARQVAEPNPAWRIHLTVGFGW